MQVKTGFAELDGTRLYYELAGSGDPIVLIHGNAGDCRHWDEQFGILSRNHQVIRYDVRGFGKSSLPVEGQGYSHHDDLRALLVHLGISAAHITGFSMGCQLAVDFVIAYPEMSASLIAEGPWVQGYNSPAAQELGALFREVRRVLGEEGTEAAGDYWCNAPFSKEAFGDPRVAERVREIMADYSFWHLANEDPVRGVDPPAMQQLTKINVPALIVTADHDIEACREVADLLETSIPDARKVVIPNAAHVVHMEAPSKLNEIVLAFLADIAVKS
jgi:3-oxoadipate enol-lactonase